MAGSKISSDDILFAWCLVIVPGLFTPLGASLAFFLNPERLQGIPLALAFAAGVLAWVALVGLHPEALEAFTVAQEKKYATHFEDRYAWLPRFSVTCSIILGMLAGLLMDRIAHSIEHMAEGHSHSNDSSKSIGHHDHGDTHHHDLGIPKPNESGEGGTLDNRNGNSKTHNKNPNSRTHLDVNLNPMQRVFTEETEEPEISNDLSNNSNGTPNDIELQPNNEDMIVYYDSPSNGNQTPNLDNNTSSPPPFNKPKNIESVKTQSVLKSPNSSKGGWSDGLRRTDTGLTQEQHKHLQRASIINFVAVIFHNFPEGIATFTAAIAERELGLLVAIAFALHELPLGIAVGTPVYLTSGSKLKTLLWALVCGMSDCFGAAVGHVLVELGGNLHDNVSGILFSFVAGVMLWTAYKELLPQAREYDPTDRVTTYLLFAGFITMDAVFIIFDGTGGHGHGSEDDGHAAHRRRLMSFFNR